MPMSYSWACDTDTAAPAGCHGLHIRAQQPDVRNQK